MFVCTKNIHFKFQAVFGLNFVQVSYILYIFWIYVEMWCSIFVHHYHTKFWFVQYKIYTNLVFCIIFVYIMYSFCTHFLVRVILHFSRPARSHSLGVRLTILNQILQSHGKSQNPEDKLSSWMVFFLRSSWMMFQYFCNKKNPNWSLVISLVQTRSFESMPGLL